MRRRRRITLSSPDGVVLEGRCRGRRPRKDVCLVSPLPDMYMVPDESIAPIYLYLDWTSIAGPVDGTILNYMYFIVFTGLYIPYWSVRQPSTRLYSTVELER